MSLRNFRILSIAEAVSWLCLIGASILKRTHDFENATQIMGPIHGIIFLVYAGAVLYVRDDLKWSGGRTILALVAALVPLGTVLLVERRYLTEAQADAATPSTI